MTFTSHAPRVDTGPLSWVIGEIRESLARSGTALGEAAGAGPDAGATALLHAKTHLHQAHGALQMVDVDGVGMLTQAAEHAIDRFKDGTLALTAANAAVVGEAYSAVVEYLEELMAGAAAQPTRLFPYYQALLTLQGAERIHPADLLFVDLSMPVQLAAPAADADADYAACRARFEKALLPFLKSADAASRRSNAQALADALAPVPAAQDEPHARAFWQAMHAFADLVARGQLGSDLNVKQLFGMINLQLRRLTQGQGGLPETMLRDALFYIAATGEPSPEAQALRQAYRLDGLVPADYEARRYGRVDAAALKAAKDALVQTKSGWDKIASDSAVKPADSFNDALATLAGASDKLGAPALAQLLRELGQAATDAIAAHRSDELGMEMATAMLFVEQSLDQVRQLPDNFEEHAEIVGARLLALAAGETPPEAPQWQGELAQKSQHGQTVAVLAGEIKAGLRQIEKILDDYHGGVVQRPALSQVEPLLHQLEGALSMLDQEQALRAVLRVRDDVRGMISGATEGGPQAPVLQQIARNVGALGFFTDMLAQHGASADARFVFDAADGVFREIPFEEIAQEASPFEIELPEAAFEPVRVEAPPVAPAPQEEASIEEELLEIFISEAQEVLALVASNLPAAERAPDSQETLTQLRRSFHTLKGSGRMVGLDEFASAAAAIEKTMNLWLSEARSATPQLLGMLGAACTELTAWVDELAATGSSARSGAALVAAAERIQHGSADDVAEAPAPMAVAVDAAPRADDAIATVASMPHVDEVDMPAVDSPADSVEAALQPEEALAGVPDVQAVEALPADEVVEAVPVAADAVPSADDHAVLPAVEAELDAVAEVAEATAPAADLPHEQEQEHDQQQELVTEAAAADLAATPEDNNKRFGDLDIPLPLYNIYLAETDELMRLLTRDFGEWRHEPQRAVTPAAMKAVHTLAGTSATVGFHALRDIAHALEMSLQTLQAPARLLDDAQRDLLDATLEKIRVMLQRFAQGDLAPEQPDVVAQLNALCAELAARAPALAATDDGLDGRLDALFSDTLAVLVDEPPVFEQAPEPEIVAAPVAGDDFDDLFGADVDDPFAAPNDQAAPAIDTAAVFEQAPEASAHSDDAQVDAPADHAPQPEAVHAQEHEQAFALQADAPVDEAAQTAFALETAAGPEHASEFEPELALEHAAGDEPEVSVDHAPEHRPELAFDHAPEPEAEPVHEHVAGQSAAELAQAADAASAPVPEHAAELQEEAGLAHAADSEEALLDDALEPQAEQPVEHAPLLETAAEPEQEATPEVASELAADPESVLEIAPEIEPEAVLDVAPEPEPEAMLEIASAHEPEPVLEIAAESEPEPVLETAAEPEPVSELEMADESEPEPEAILELASEPEPESILELASEPEPEAVPEIASEHEPEPVLEAASVPEPEPEPVLEAALVPEPEPEPVPEIAPEPARVLQLAPEPAPAAAPAVAAEQPREAESEPALTAEAVFSDELDADLMPVFLEEASDLLPEIGNGLRQWQQVPGDIAPAQRLLRLLHTVKGSARMAGAMRLGQHAHELETQIENMVHAGTTAAAAFDELLANYDQSLLLFEQLQQPAAAAAPQVAAPVALAPVVEDAAAQRSPMVRVRADILDRLVNQAGEVSITRSKLESQIGTLQHSLTDFADNLARLRRQLREVEIQAESQMASRMSIAGEREFDPLEFDRFTRLQELTRMMAESVNDVASFHDSLARSIEGASGDLAAQSRLTRDLQRDLMRVRMVPFASLSERLFRVARQTAKEIDKRVNLDIRGGSVEIDRGVLEQMAAPFEHLLRNAIVHGIETREMRGASGKSETGELLVQVSQQGNEVVIQFSDDGAGLNLDRIRAKALANGLVAPNTHMTDAATADLIFTPGFSTADALTELAGRGVGMDVVRSQAQSLGGRVVLQTERNKGARFTIHLPLTLAVTQVVLTTCGGKTWALPSTLVEQVLQLKEAALAEAHAKGVIMAQGQPVPFHFLSTLLADGAKPLTQRSSPVLILKSGSERVAVQVDEVQGNREVVIKNIGPQLARMVGISGATVLGSGAIVLILNPVALAQQGMHADAHRMREAALPEVPVRNAVVMVVDDSLTVRRVTQRLLEREGYQVMLAKDGVDALEQLQQTTPDLMLVDIEMPRMDGFDLTRNVRGSDRTSAIPIIMITSRTADKHRNYALDLGVNAYFGKPFQEPVLLAAIAGLLGREMPVAHA